jgi:hypothetical protein
MNQSLEQEPRILVVHNRFRGMELGGQFGPQSQQIFPSIQFRSRVPKVYSHPHSTPQMISMGNHRIGHRQIQST